MWCRARAGRLDPVLQAVIWEVDVLHWKPRIVALAAALALVAIVLGGLGVDVPYNLYW